MSIRFAAILSLALMALASRTMADTLDKIQGRGVIVVGVKADYRPWGFFDATGKIIGLEIDLARDIADQLGVQLETVPVTTTNRIEFLRQGKIDLILATMSDNPRRRETVGVIDPPYYSGGTSILVRKSLGLRRWEDLRDRKVCGVQGAYYNRLITERYGAQVVAFAGVPEAQSDLLTGNCIAFVQDRALITSTLSGDPKWTDYEMPLPPIDEQPWVMAVPPGERDSRYGKQITDIVIGWHKTGRIIELEKTWGIPPTVYPQMMHQKYR